MAVRALRSAPAEHLEDLSYLIAHLNADPAAAPFAPDPEAGYAALKAQNEDWSSKRFTMKEAQTALANADETLNNVVRTAQAVILDDLRHNRRSPRFLTYFPRGLVAFTRASYQDQLTAVRSLAQRCAQDPNPKIREQAATLDAAADRVGAAFVRRSEALVSESTAYGQLQVQKLATIDTCRRVGYRLAELYPNEPDRVRSYFRKTYRRPSPAAPAAGEPTATAGAATTGTAATGATTTGSGTTGTTATETAPKVTAAGPALVLTSAGVNL